MYLVTIPGDFAQDLFYLKADWRWTRSKRDACRFATHSAAKSAAESVGNGAQVDIL